MKKAVIIGAGQTGRGFIAPIAEDNGYQLVFVDKDEELVAQLKKEERYTVRYFGNAKPERTIENFKAYTTEEKEALEEIAASDVVFVSVFASHIQELTGLFQKSAKMRGEKKLTILCCENGVNVKQPLLDAGVDAVISEGIIFCTTLKPEKEKLDLISQDYPEIPIDGKAEGLEIHLEGMPHEQDFPSLIQRKIYTYNFISAIVAYLGSYKGYEVYGEAANDEEIAAVISAVVPVVSSIIARKYEISYETQLAFTRNAVAKFQNREIYDTIYRNARQAERKLGEEERLLTPLRLAYEYQENTWEIELVIAAALYYGKMQEGMQVEGLLQKISQMLGTETVSERITGFYYQLQQNMDLAEILTKAAVKN